MKILLLEKYPEIKREYLDYLEKNNEIYELSDNYKKQDIEVIIIRSNISVDKNVLDDYPNLKFIARV
jgi:phosphoglycerate dehydrogenase-like enzyme